MTHGYKLHAEDYDEEVDQLFDEGRAVVLFLYDDDVFKFIDEAEKEIDIGAVRIWLNSANIRWNTQNIFKKRILITFGDDIEAKLFKIRFGITSTKEQWKTVGGITNT